MQHNSKCQQFAPQPVSIDWLGVSLFTEESRPKLWEGMRWVVQSQTNVWGLRMIAVNEDAEKVFTWLAEPRSSIIDRRAALLEVANEWLYHGITPQLILHRLQEVNHIAVVGVSRIDLCVDFECLDRHYEVIMGLNTEKYYVGGKLNGSGFWSVSSDRRMAERWHGIRCPHCKSWGHKRSDVKWKLYYKWKELCEAAGAIGFEKPYIVEMWVSRGMMPQNVWRLEVSIKQLSHLTYNGQPITLDDVLTCPDVHFWSLYKSRFTIREDQGHKDRTNDRIVDFLEVNIVAGTTRCRVYGSDHQRNGCISLLRKLVLSVEDDAVLRADDMREFVFAQVGELCRMRHLFAYMSAMVGMSFDEWVEAKRVQAYSDVIS